MARENVGKSAYRCKENPEEKRFADEWEKQNHVYSTLDYMMGDGGSPGEVSERDRMVAATVFQWLGSPVGQCVLRDMGYTREKKTTE